MALTFNGTSSKLTGSNLVTGYPFSMFCWIRPGSLTASQFVMGCGDFGGATEAAMMASGDIAGDPVRVFVRDTAATSVNAASTASMQQDTWQPALCVFRSNTSRSVYFADGSAMVTNNTSKTLTFANFDRTIIGARPISDTTWFVGDIAHVAIWNAALENDDWLNLRYGVAPSSVQPQALVDYWSLDTQAATQTGTKGNVLTAANTSQAGTSPTMDQSIPDSLPVRDDAGWCWFSDPRAVHYNGATYIGWIAPNGTIGITKYAHSTKHRDYFILSPNFEQDDHDNPTIYIRPDGRLVVFWSLHNDPTGISYRISTNAEDITAWGSTQTISTPDGDTSYNNPRYLSGNDRLYQHFRVRTGATSTRPQYLTYSDDDGATWSTPVIAFTTANHRPYVKSITNGTDRIDFYMSQGNPGENGLITNVYHAIAKLDAGALKFYKSDGTTEISLPITITTTLDKVYDSTASGVSGWQWDAKYGSDGHPRILFERAISSTDNRYCFSRWNGSAWTTPVEICTAGGRITNDVSSEYTGGLCFSADSVDRVIVSRESGGIANLEEWATTDNGATWAKARDITTDSTASIINARPVAPDDAAPGAKLLWWHGTYTSYTNFNTDLFLEAGPVVGALVATESGSDTAAISGTATTSITGSLSVTESGSDTAAIAGGVLVAGALIATETGSDTAAITGGALISGALSVTESGADAASIAGGVLVQGALAATEIGADVAAFTGDASEGVFGSFALTEAGQDTAAISGGVVVTGALSASEGADTAIFVGDVLVQCSFALVESVADTASISGSSSAICFGSMAATESGSDVAAITNIVQVVVLAAARTRYRNTSTASRSNRQSATRPRNLN